MEIVHTIYKLIPNPKARFRIKEKVPIALGNCEEKLASSWVAVPLCAALTVVFVLICYSVDNVVVEGENRGEAFAWLDGASAWPTIAILFFALLLSVHFIIKSNYDLRQNAEKLSKFFGLSLQRRTKRSRRFWSRRFCVHARRLWSMWVWDAPPLTLVGTNSEGRIDVEFLWNQYVRRGKIWARFVRTLPMFGLYLSLLFFVSLLVGFPRMPLLRGHFPFLTLLIFTSCVFLFLTFFVVDATLLHEGFLNQLRHKESYWPQATFSGFQYPGLRNQQRNESELAYYWDIVLISKRTVAVGNLIYYPFFILFLIIIARLPCFDNWSWQPAQVVAITMDFCIALYAAWRIPRAASLYRDFILGELKKKRRQALMAAARIPEVVDTIVEDVKSTHKGAFAYLWDQPAVRALLLPSTGFGLITLLQYIPH